MSKLIDEVVEKVTTALMGPTMVYIPGAVSAVLNEMFEERAVRYFAKPLGIKEKWYLDDPTLEGSSMIPQTILVPRAKPEPTLAEEAKVLCDYMDSLNPTYRLTGLVQNVRAALAREEGK